MFKTKILVLGPKESGKSMISNFLAEATEMYSGEYHPTQGCRILEYENALNIKGKSVKTDVELWDCSGDRKFETCWPAIAKDANGILFVFNPDKANHDKELENWYEYFVKQGRVKDSHCIVFSHSKEKGPDTLENVQLSQEFSKIPLLHTNLEDDGDTLREEFDDYLSRIISALSDRSEQEELSIMNSR